MDVGLLKTSPSHVKVLLMENISQQAAKCFEDEGFTVTQAVKYSEEELIEAIKDVNIIGVRSKTKLPERVLKHAKKLIAIGCFCIGTDQTDLAYAARKGIPVFNAPYANTRSVSELVIAEIIMLARQAGDRSMEIHRGEWNKKSDGCYEVRGKTLGIVGYGHVGSQLSVLAESIGMKVIFHDVENKLQLGNAKQVESLEVLLATSDFVSLHVPADNSTRKLINAATVKLMKKGSYLINAARGSVVEIGPVAEALRNGDLAGAAFDVYPSEVIKLRKVVLHLFQPSGHVKDWAVCLQGCPNTILTPHIGGSTEEAQAAIGMEVAGKLTGYLSRGSTSGAVNVPEINVSRRLSSNQSRVISFHENVPGVLRDINNIISIANISSQQLDTNSDVGYLVVDLETDQVLEVRERLHAVDHNIRLRLLFPGPGYCAYEPNLE